MKVYVSFMVNSEDSELIGVYNSMANAVKETFVYLINLGYMETINPNGDILSDNQFLDILKRETEGWKKSKVFEICWKYNKGFCFPDMFISITETELSL